MTTSRALRALAALALAAAAPTLARAQTSADSAAPSDAPASAVRPLTVGDPIRLESTSGNYMGTLARLGADTVIVAERGRNVSVLRTNVRQVERSVNRGTRGPAMRRGALIGLGAGLVVGLAAGQLAGNGNPNALGSFAAEGGILGALVGTMVGPSFRQEQWEHVELPPPGVAASASASAQRD